MSEVVDFQNVTPRRSSGSRQIEMHMHTKRKGIQGHSSHWYSNCDEYAFHSYERSVKCLNHVSEVKLAIL